MKKNLLFLIVSGVLALGALTLEAQKIRLDKEAPNGNPKSRTTRDFIFNDKTQNLEWWDGLIKKGQLPYSAFQAYSEEVKGNRFFMKVKLFKTYRGRDTLVTSVEVKKKNTKGPGDHAAQFRHKIRSLEYKVSYDDIHAGSVWILKNRKDLLGQLESSNVYLLAREVNAQNNELKKKNKAIASQVGAMAKNNRIEVVTNAKVQQRMVDFAKDNKKNRNIHVQMVASQFNGAEHPSHHDIAIPKRSVNYVTDRTQGPYAQLANPFNAERLRLASFTSKNKKGFHGFQGVPFYSRQMEANPMEDFIKNGYLLFDEKDIPFLKNHVVRNYEHINSAVVMEMPVFGKILDAKHYLYTPEPHGKVTIVAASAIPAGKSYGNPTYSEKTASIHLAALKAGYETTILQGLYQWQEAFKKSGYDLKKVPKLHIHLTLLGGGAFTNPRALIFEAMTAAVEKYGKIAPMQITIEEFGNKGASDLQKAVQKMNEALAK